MHFTNRPSGNWELPSENFFPGRTNTKPLPPRRPAAPLCKAAASCPIPKRFGFSLLHSLGACLAAIMPALMPSAKISHLRIALGSPKQDFRGCPFALPADQQGNIKPAPEEGRAPGLLHHPAGVTVPPNARLVHTIRKILADSRGMMGGCIFL